MTDVTISSRASQPPPTESPLPPSRSRQWRRLLLGVLAFALAIFGLDIPDRIEKGILAQEAIRALDAMRQPILEIHRLDLGPSQAHPEQYRHALETLEERMETYRRSGAFDPSLASKIEEFETGLRKWLALRERAPNAPAVLPSSMREEKHALITALELLARGEAPIHQAIDDGQRAETILLLLSLLLAGYAVILFQLFERRWSRVLAARERDLEATLNSIGDAVIATDTEGRVTRMNPVAERLTGWGLADARGRPLEEVFHIVNAETGEPVESPVTKVLREGQVVGLANHTQLISRKGDRFQIADSGAPVFGHDGSIRGVILVFRDVTGEYSLRREVEEQAQRLATMIQSALDAVIVADDDGRILEWNPSAEAIFGWNSEDIQGRYLHETIIPPDLRQAHLDGLARMREGQPGRILGKRIETRGLRSNGMEFPLELTIVRLHQRDRCLFGAYIRDLTEQKVTENELRLAATTFNTHAGILITDPEGHILRVNPAFEAMSGYSARELIGKKPNVLKSGLQDEDFYERMWEDLIQAGQWQGELWNRRKDGRLYAEWLTITAVYGEAGEITHFVGTTQDITERKKAEERIEHLAYYDDLTDLANRRLLRDRLQHEIAVARRHDSYGALLFLDLDRFKHLNDALGHPIGDELLVQVADRLRGAVRAEDTVARLGGDEFVVLLPALGHELSLAGFEAQAVAEKIRGRLSEPYDLQGHRYHLGVSIGIVLFPEGDEDADDVLKHADSALYRAKDEGRNTVRFYQPGMQAAADARLTMEKDLRVAMEADDQLFLHYQPQVNAEGRLVGTEALIRWKHPTRGWVAPIHFIPVAEETGLIRELGEWVLRTAVAQLKEWMAADLCGEWCVLSLNVSPKEFHQPDFVSKILRVIEESEVPAGCLDLEITENVVMDNVGEAVEKMHALREAGLRFTIDDFGTGYSSLSYLKRLPLDKLKIDRSFVTDIHFDPNDAAIVETIIAMAQHLGLGIVAEGVETREELDFLLEKGCDVFQGYYFARPMPAAEFSDFIRKRGCKTKGAT